MANRLPMSGGDERHERGHPEQPGGGSDYLPGLADPDGGGEDVAGYSRDYRERNEKEQAEAHYRTIVADPPWRYRSKDILTRGWHRTASVESGKERPGHYTTMTNAEIAALDVAGLAADDAMLFMWVTNPRLYGERDGSWTPRQIVEAWGFRYITLLTWVKTGAPGLGFYFRGNTEHVVFAIRGSIKIPPALRESNVIVAPKGGHSEKPDAFYDLVERVSPEPRLELFARRARFGWDYWGDESLGTAEMGVA